jgi:radical SAM superfamily enzyme YgiQ (UPF0313 family)
MTPLKRYGMAVAGRIQPLPFDGTATPMFGLDPLTYRHRVFRPPAEADSLIVQVAYGCPHNHCLFCGMYKGVPYSVRPWPEVRQELQRAARHLRDTRRVFLADGDVLHLPFAQLREMLGDLNGLFPALARVNLYANGRSILAKTEAELCELRRLKVQTLYMGLESGDEDILRAQNKADTVAEMVLATQRAQAQGLRLSVMVLLGLGAREGSERHADATAAALNRMQPRLLSALRVVPIPGTPLQRLVDEGRFLPLTEYETVVELRRLVAGLELEGTIFRANHVSNVLPVEARLPKDKARVLAELDAALASGTLDRASAGPMPFTL